MSGRFTYLAGGAGNDLLVVDWRGKTASAPWTDIGRYASGFERLMFQGSDHNDVVDGTIGNDTIFGGFGDDRITLNGGADRVSVGDGNDTVLGVSGNDTVTGGTGQDRAELDLSAMASGIRLVSGRGFGNVSGFEAYSGLLTGFDDVMVADDRIATMNGGAGHDHLILNLADHTGSGLRLSGGGGYSSYVMTISQNARAYLTSWEALTITATDAADYMQAWASNDVLVGLGGDDTIGGGTGRNTVVAGDGNDTIAFTAGAQDSLYGGAGDDYFEGNGLGADDRLFGGAGIDRVSVSYVEDSGVTLTINGIAGELSGIEVLSARLTNHDDIARFNGAYAVTVYGEFGQDLVVLNFSATVDRFVMDNNRITVWRIGEATPVQMTFDDFERLELIGTAGNDTITGFLLDNRLFGMAGNDKILSAATGNNVLYGGTGNDTLLGSYTDVRMYGGAGDDSLLGSFAANTLLGGAGNDEVSGGNKNDTLSGDGGDDLLIGGGGDDHVFGGTGDDAFIGNEGNDRMTGGGGADIFAFEGILPSGDDLITDFDAGLDRLYFSGGFAEEHIQVTTSGDDLLVTWAAGSLRLIGSAGDSIVVLYDGDFV